MRWATWSLAGPALQIAAIFLTKSSESPTTASQEAWLSMWVWFLNLPLQNQALQTKRRTQNCISKHINKHVEAKRFGMRGTWKLGGVEWSDGCV